MALRLRRGTDAERLTITPLSGELIYVTDTKVLYVGDGTTQGGVEVGSSNIVNDTSPQLGGNLDLNGNNITGTGNININGTITATGNINLGDGSEDNVFVGGQLTSGLIPNVDGAHDIGSAVLRWRNGYFGGLSVDGEITAFGVNARLVADDSTTSYDPSTGSFSGDIRGTVFGDDSTVLVDGVGSIIVGNVVNNSVITKSIDVSRDGSNIAVSRFFTNTDGGANDLEFNSHRGTVDTPTDISVGDGVIDIVGKAYHTGDYRPVGLMRFRTDSGGSFNNPTSGLPGSILFSVFNNAGGQDLAGTMELTQRGLVVNTFGDFGPESLKVGGDAKITGTLTVPQLVGDVKGSVFGDDSTILVDAVNNTIPGYVSISDLKTALQDGAGDYAAFKAWILANL